MCRYDKGSESKETLKETSEILFLEVELKRLLIL